MTFHCFDLLEVMPGFNRGKMDPNGKKEQTLQQKKVLPASVPDAQLQHFPMQTYSEVRPIAFNGTFSQEGTACVGTKKI